VVLVAVTKKTEETGRFFYFATGLPAASFLPAAGIA